MFLPSWQVSLFLPGKALYLSCLRMATPTLWKGFPLSLIISGNASQSCLYRRARTKRHHATYLPTMAPCHLYITHSKGATTPVIVLLHRGSRKVGEALQNSFESSACPTSITDAQDHPATLLWWQNLGDLDGARALCSLPHGE